MQPQTITIDLVGRVNALQERSRRFIDCAQISPLSREWREIKRQADALARVDARSSWEIHGMLLGLCGDREGMEAAFEKSLALGVSSSNKLNLMVNRLNLGLFSLAQEVYSEVGAPENGHFTTMVHDGYKAGAIFRVNSFIEEAQGMGIKWEGDADLATELKTAVAVLAASGINDEFIARRMNLAGDILHKHRLRLRIRPSVVNEVGEFVGVTYHLPVPVGPSEAFAMNLELAEAEIEAGIESDATFEVVFEAGAE